MKHNITEIAKLQGWLAMENEFIERGLSTREESKERLVRMIKDSVLRRQSKRVGEIKA